MKFEQKIKSINKINDLIIDLKSENEEIEENSDSNDENEKIDIIEILKKYFFNIEEVGKISINEDNQSIFVKKRKLVDNPYRKIFLDLIQDNFKNKSDFNYYNFISTIFIPLLNLYINFYEKENSSNYSSQNILSHLPLLGNNKHYLNCETSGLLIDESYQNEEKKMKKIGKIININHLLEELYEKQYNISSYLIGLLINLSSFFEEELFDFDLYLKNIEYKKWKDESADLRTNNFIENMKKLIYLNSETNINIIKKALFSLIPYFTELLNNNFYLFLPYKIINLLKFFIKFLTYHFFLFDNDKILKDKFTTKLIQLFVNLNLKLLYSKNTTDEFTFNILENIKFLYNIFLLIKQKHISSSINVSFDDLDTHENEDYEDIKDFRYFFKDNDLKYILRIIELNFEQSDDDDEDDDQKYLYKFLIYFGKNKLSENNNIENLFIPLILKKIDSDDNNFWFKTLIIDCLVNKQLITKIHKIENILDTEYEEFLTNYEEKLIKYFISITKNLNFISCFIDNEKILKKYFNFYLDEEFADINSKSPDNNILENEEKDNFSIYFYLINLASLIIKNLLNSKFFEFFQAIIVHINREDFKVKYLLEECFSFLKKVIIEIPNKFQEMLLENDEERKNEINNNINKDKKKDVLSEDLKNYFSYLIQKISVRDIDKLSSLLSKSIAITKEYKEYTTSKLNIFDESLKNYYNLVHKNTKKNNDKNLNKCPICLDKESDIHLSPCEHMFCFDCIQKLDDRKCPKCRKIMKGIKEHPEFLFC